MKWQAAMGAVLGFAAAAAAGDSRFEFVEPHMGTKFRIVLYAKDEASAKPASRAAFDRVAALNRIMSDYDPNSELMRLCKQFAEHVGEPVRVSPELAFVLARGQEIAAKSDGAFDMTVGPLVLLWRQARRTQKLPSAAEIADAQRRVGYRKLEVDEKARTVRLRTPGMQLDLGGIAKGYAADEALAVLKKHGVTRALVAAGGDIAVADPPPDAPGWKVDIQPLLPGEPPATLRLANAAASTSGDSQQFTLIEGVRYSHIVDPKTGLGLTGRRSVTIIAKNGVTADSMTKAVMMLEPDKALALVEATDAAAALIVTLDKGAQESRRESKRLVSYVGK